MDPSLETYLWLALGFLGGAALFVYAKSYGRAGRYVLAQGLVVAALVYVVFAAVAGDRTWLVYEGLGVVAFGIFAWLGVRRSLLWLAFGWGLHALWDLVLHGRGTAGAAHAPEWYVVACLSFDLLIAVLILRDRRGSAKGLSAPDRSAPDR